MYKKVLFYGNFKKLQLISEELLGFNKLKNRCLLGYKL